MENQFRRSNNSRKRIKTGTRTYPEGQYVDNRVHEWPRQLLREAQETVGSPTASIMTSASAVDAMLKLNGYTDGSLNQRINQAAQNYLITEGMKKWAHKVRLDANAQRHADEEAAFPTMEEAVRTLEMAKMLGHFLFVIPEMVKEGQEKAASGEGRMEPLHGQGQARNDEENSR